MDLIELVSGSGSAMIYATMGIAAFFVFLAILKGIIKVNLPDRLLVITGLNVQGTGKHLDSA